MSEGRALLFAYLINLFAFLGGFLWKNNKYFIVCSAVGGVRDLGTFYSPSNCKDMD